MDVHRLQEAFRSSRPPAALEAGARLGNQQFKQFFHAWSSVLTAYSQCALTKPSDKFIAVNGLIKTISERTGLTPTVGLWAEYMLPGLMWHTYNPDLMPPSTLCPTWSWAAVDTPFKLTYKEPAITSRNESILVTLGTPGIYHGMIMHVKYELAWMNSFLSGTVRTTSNGAATGQS